MDIDSPCQKKCKLHEDICIGCGRTLEDITLWSILSSDERILRTKAAFKRYKQYNINNERNYDSSNE